VLARRGLADAAEAHGSCAALVLGVALQNAGLDQRNPADGSALSEESSAMIERVFTETRRRLASRHGIRALLPDDEQPSTARQRTCIMVHRISLWTGDGYISDLESLGGCREIVRDFTEIREPPAKMRTGRVQ